MASLDHQNQPENGMNAGGLRDDLFSNPPLHADEERTRMRRRIASWAGFLILVVGSVAVVSFPALQLSVSVLPTKQHAPFDGTVYPFDKTPNWVAFSPDDYKLPFEQLPSDKLMAIPRYDAAALVKPIESLVWKNPADDVVRNQKITYSVPYMGSYRLNGKEFDGSHLAVDIKVPMNTPVRSIANGVVIKVATPSSGFGKHIVIEHDNVPSVDDASTLTTYYSSYSHLGSLTVSEGDVVTKGQIVGLSGETGFATTPHMHFQIDRAVAPWHPYWGFSYQDQQAAGLDFVGAINAGLGKDRAIDNTINPMTFVQKYLSYTPSGATVVTPPTPTPTPVVTSSTPVVDQPPIVTPPVTPTPPTPVVESTPVSVPVPVPVQLRFAFQQQNSYLVTSDVALTVQVTDSQSGAPGSSLTQPAVLVLSGDVGVLQKNSIESGDLSNGSVTVHLLNPRVGQGQLIVLYGDQTFKSASFDVTSPVSAVPVTPVVARSALFADVSGVNPFYDSIKYMKDHGIVKGYEDGTFKPTQLVSRVEALKMILKAGNRQIAGSGKTSFTDVPRRAWFAPYVATAFNSGIVQGYFGKLFKPNQEVTRAEFIKMALTAMAVPLEPVVLEAPYSDVAVSDWSAPYVQYAKQKNLLTIADGAKLNSNESITRQEVADILYRLSIVTKTGALHYTVALGMD